MKYIITEEQNIRLYVKRRIEDIMKYVRSTTIYRSPCRADNIDHYLTLLRDLLFMNVPFDVYVDMDMITGKDYIWDLIMSVRGNEVIDNYNQKCIGKSINESKSPRIRRVLHIIKQYIDNLDPNDICTYWDREEGDRYVNQTMSDLIVDLETLYFKEEIDYDEIYDELVDYGVRQDIAEFFYDTIDSCTE